MIRRIDPDEAVTINGIPVTAWQLAEARQELSHRGVHNPRWTELSQHDQETAALSAGGWLRALAELIDAAGPAQPERVRTEDGCYRTGSPAAGGSITWNPDRGVITVAHPGAVWVHECWPNLADLLAELLQHGGDDSVWAQLEHVHKAITKLTTTASAPNLEQGGAPC